MRFRDGRAGLRPAVRAIRRRASWPGPAPRVAVSIRRRVANLSAGASCRRGGGMLGETRLGEDDVSAAHHRAIDPIRRLCAARGGSACGRPSRRRLDPRGRHGRSLRANITIGPDVVKALRPHTKKTMDVHLMIAPCDPYLEAFAKAGSDIITVHVEAGPHLHRSLQAIRALGKKAGVTLNPGTPVETIENVIDLVDLILVMSVNPGFGGQAFIASAVDKIRNLRAMAGGRPIDIEIDGGVTPQNAAQVAAAGANVLVAGSAVFKGGHADGYRANIAAIRNAAALARGEAA